MTIHIEALTFDVIIGILDFEREVSQSVMIDLTLNYDYQENQFINYAQIVELITDDMKEKRYRLLEDALIGLKVLLYTAYPQMKTLSLKISKPDILPQCNVALSHQWKF
ncbi:MAG: dihydroneopterin aldolase [Campylobacterota bacterium]|nr:dihydroneopterin aldolase [Campylobacterota bacterium]